MKRLKISKNTITIPNFFQEKCARYIACQSFCSFNIL